MNSGVGEASPAALAYEVMPAYRAVHELLEAMWVKADSLRPRSGPFAVRLRENAIHALLNTAEAGARIDPVRFGPDAFIRMAEKSLMVAMAVMMERARHGPQAADAAGP